MSQTLSYKHLEPRPGSHYRQWFVKGRRIRAVVLYRETIGEEPRSAQDVAEDYDLPLEAVNEAIDYCQRNPEVLQADWEMEEASVRADELKWPSLKPGVPLPPS